jgi:hypothetical protein
VLYAPVGWREALVLSEHVAKCITVPCGKALADLSRHDSALQAEVLVKLLQRIRAAGKREEVRWGAWIGVPRRSQLAVAAWRRHV